MWRTSASLQPNDPADNMRESVQKYLLDIMDDGRSGPIARAVKCVLWTLSQLYRVVIWARLRLYDMGIFRRRSLGCLTISVGNITVGGTGKTPVVEMLARSLSERGRRVAILSRGYKSKHPRRGGNRHAPDEYSPRVVSDGKRVLLDADHAGDEPYLLARNLNRVSVLVDKNRVEAGRYAMSHMGVDTVILDDGFQYLALGQRLDLVLIDCTNPFGNGHLLPRGVLREPLSALKRANYFLLTKTGGLELEPIRHKLREINPTAEIAETAYKPLYFEEVTSGRRQQPKFVRGKNVHVVSAIARPDSFEKTVEKLGARIRKRLRFVDHHRFSREEIHRIVAEASADGADCILTTQKDAVRLPPLKSTHVPVLFLRVAVKITRGPEDFADSVLRACHV